MNRWCGPKTGRVLGCRNITAGNAKPDIWGTAALFFSNLESPLLSRRRRRVRLQRSCYDLV